MSKSPAEAMRAAAMAAKQKIASSSTSDLQPEDIDNNKAQTVEQLMYRVVGGQRFKVTNIIVPNKDLKEKVCVHPLNKRSPIMLSRRNMQGLLDDIKANNNIINEAALCVYNPTTNTYEAIDGSRRLKAATILGADLPILVIDQEISNDVIKAHIKSTNTSIDFSEYEKLLIVFEEFDEVELKNPSATEKERWEIFKVMLEDEGFAIGRTHIYRYRCIYDEIKPNYFIHGRVNLFGAAGLDNIGRLLRKLRKSQPDLYTESKIEEIFKKTFDLVEDDYEHGSYTQKEFLNQFKKVIGVKSNPAPKTEPNVEVIKIFEDDDYSIELTKNGDVGWTITSNTPLPRALIDGIKQICEEKFS